MLTPFSAKLVASSASPRINSTTSDADDEDEYNNDDDDDNCCSTLLNSRAGKIMSGINIQVSENN